MDVVQVKPEVLVANVEHLVSLPDIYIRLEETLKNPDHTLQHICSIICVDPALSARVLKIVNSSLYALPNNVNDVSIAVNLLGENEIENMVLVLSLLNSTALVKNTRFDISRFWKHSIRCGVAAKLLSRRSSSIDESLMFLIGVLHDIGQLVMYVNDEISIDVINKQMKDDDVERYLAEQNYFGFDHALVGFLLLSQWNFSKKICDILKNHHYQLPTGQYRLETKIITLADQFSHVLDMNDDVSAINIGVLPTQLQSGLIDMDIEPNEALALLGYIKEQSQSIEQMIT